MKWHHQTNLSDQTEIAANNICNFWLTKESGKNCVSRKGANKILKMNSYTSESKKLRLAKG
jgi:hypothetical protein